MLVFSSFSLLILKPEGRIANKSRESIDQIFSDILTLERYLIIIDSKIERNIWFFNLYLYYHKNNVTCLILTILYKYGIIGYTSLDIKTRWKISFTRLSFT